MPKTDDDWIGPEQELLDQQTRIVHLEAQLATKDTEIARLREALGKFDQFYSEAAIAAGPLKKHEQIMWDYARAALKEEERCHLGRPL